MTDTLELLYACVGRTIVAMDRVSGRIIWSGKLSFWGGRISMLLPHNNRLYVGRGSEVYCLDRFTGRQLWKQKLGHSGLVLLSISGADLQQIASAHAARASAPRSGDGGGAQSG